MISILDFILRLKVVLEAKSKYWDKVVDKNAPNEEVWLRCIVESNESLIRSKGNSDTPAWFVNIYASDIGNKNLISEVMSRKQIFPASLALGILNFFGGWMDVGNPYCGGLVLGNISSRLIEEMCRRMRASAVPIMSDSEGFTLLIQLVLMLDVLVMT
ncbi:hypothetical protein CsSME_00020593 [Camellia sinensis var. sinensis]